MISLAAVWYLQDLLQVMFSGRFLVPDLFFLFLVFRLAVVSRDVPAIVWPAFLGGLLWDFRWTALPGLTATAYAVAAAACALIWNHIPDSGRTPRLFWVLALCGHLLTGFARFMAWGDGRSALFGVFAVQQVAAVPLLLIAVLVVSARSAGPDVKR
ncbi:MAG: hypothetical protein Q7I97_02195 [Thermovirgaceae bacterium]|nr:hypothetical protein [Thermovirgaceae bacterium]